MFSSARFVCSRPGTPSEATVGDLTGSANLLVPGRVIASTRIPQGALSMPINPKSLQGNTDVVQISVGTNSFGTLELADSSHAIWNQNVHWLRALRLADDCHSYNVQLRKLPRQDKPKLVLQVVRSVEAGQELLLWFSEDILATLHMGFLTPANIQGQKNYVCTRCSALYESPNPLKLHLTLSCGKYSMTSLWDKLSQRLMESDEKDIRNEFRFKLTPELAVPKQKNAIDLSTPADKKIKENPLYRPYNNQQHSSAFKPFKKIELNRIDNNNGIAVAQSFVHWPRFTMPQDYVHTPLLANQNHCDDDAQIESLVSSLGKFKEGHICLYCGKSYSRKYGLKIHIRTHTGYKPLKCKFCLRPFGDPSNLNKHVRLHAEGETPYKCDLCGKVLVRRRDLERHLKSRHMNDINPVTSITDEESNGTSIDVSDEDPDKLVNVEK